MTNRLVKGIVLRVEVTNVYEAKTHLSRLLRRVRAGEEIIIAEAGRPVARLVPIAPPSGPRSLGGDEDQVWMADDFDAPLPDEVVEAFYGGAGANPHEETRAARGRSEAPGQDPQVTGARKKAAVAGRKKATTKMAAASRRSR